VTAAPTPQISVLIATHNREERLRRCLDALAKQTLEPSRFEVIVADDGSEDDTAAMAAKLELPFALRFLTLPKGGKSAALNAVLPEARAEVCLFVDDDVIASPELLSEHLQAHREEPRALCLGKLVQRQPVSKDWFVRAYPVSWNERYAALEDREPDWADCYGGNFSAPTASLRAVGGFDLALKSIEDVELGFRLVEAGCVPVYRAAAEALHDDEKDRGRILHDIVDYGRFCAVFGEHRHELRPRLLGWYRDTTPRELAIRGTLLRLRVTPAALAALGAALPGPGQRQLWFGFVNRYAFWYGVRRGLTRRRWRETTNGVPVLLYHAFTDNGERDTYVMPRRSFEWQMRLLAALRYRVISAEELVEELRDFRLPAKRTAVITVDDGYADNRDIALPILRRHRFPATVYLVGSLLGARNDWIDEGPLGDRPILDEPAIASMLDAGIRFGSHTQTHPALTKIPAAAAKDEIGVSRTQLEEALQTPVDTLAYPFGDLDDETVSLVAGSGYRGAYESHDQSLASLGDDPWRIPRIEIRGEDGIFSFLRKLWLGGNC
jgi:glycosyltransferase involved in cell wall biosynthesis